MAQIAAEDHFTYTHRPTSHVLLTRPLPNLNAHHKNLTNGTTHTSHNNTNNTNGTTTSPLPRYDVLTCGAGPAGLFHHLLLTRYLSPTSFSLLCIDSQPTSTTKGHGDGVSPRTLEVFQSLNLANDIMMYGNPVVEVVEYMTAEGKGLEKNPNPTATFKDEEGMFDSLGRFGCAFVGFNQGRVEQILEADLHRYGGDVVRDTRVVEVKLDEEGDKEYPVLATLESQGRDRQVRAKYLVGADGAHSAVRRSLGIEMVGQTTDDLYGVADFVADTNHPDGYRAVTSTTPEGTMLLIPREISNISGERLTRVYVPFNLETKSAIGDIQEQEEAQRKVKEVRQSLNLDAILEKIEKLNKPFKMKPKEDFPVEWWATYQVGQRLAARTSVPDSQDHPRIFLMGDAFHTHSPYLGQGMNVSMADGFDLSWKLSHVLSGLTPDPKVLLETYVHERGLAASNLLDMDRRWYATRYGGSGTKVAPAQIRAEILAFIAGTNLEYQDDSLVIDRQITPGTTEALGAYLNGRLREGRKIGDSMLTRFATGLAKLHLQDEIRSDGRYAIVVFSGGDLMQASGKSAQTIAGLYALKDRLPQGMVKMFIFHSSENDKLSWENLPKPINDRREYNVYQLSAKGYEKYGVDVNEGQVVVLRPDHVVGSIADLSSGETGLGKVEKYLQRVLVRAVQQNGV